MGEPPRADDRRRAGAWVAAIAVAICLLGVNGCAGGSRNRGATFPPLPPAAPATRPPPEAERVSDVPAPGAAAGSILDASARLDFRALGSVATDGFTLPLLSPDGRFMAVQTGVVPDEQTRLAQPGQRPPEASRIAFYRLAGPDPNGWGLVPLGETVAGLVLGRSADGEGFLVEGPRPDGSRWIGRIDWSAPAREGGVEPRWLVEDARVNAFAALGPGGALAYSSRQRDQRRFDLVVRSEGREVRLDGDGIRSYVHPTFASDGSRLLAIALRDGIAELTDVDPRSQAAIEQSIARTLVSDRADERVAAQMLAPQGARDAPLGDDWLVFHPGLGSLIRWRGGTEVRPLPGGALAVGVLDASRIAVFADDGVRLRRLDPSPGAPRDRGFVIQEGVAVPRRLEPVDGAPAVLLVAPERNGVRLTVVRALPDRAD